jgi:hypothetical protein
MQIEDLLPLLHQSPVTVLAVMVYLECKAIRLCIADMSKAMTLLEARTS